MQTFCGHECWVQFNVQTGSGGAIRKHVFELERGVCQRCRLDCHALFTSLRALKEVEDRRRLLCRTPFALLDPHRVAAMLDRPTEGLFWQVGQPHSAWRGGPWSGFFLLTPDPGAWTGGSYHSRGAGRWRVRPTQLPHPLYRLSRARDRRAQCRYGALAFPGPF